MLVLCTVHSVLLHPVCSLASCIHIRCVCVCFLFFCFLSRQRYCSLLRHNMSYDITTCLPSVSVCVCMRMSACARLCVSVCVCVYACLSVQPLQWLQLQALAAVQVYVQSTFDQYLILSLNWKTFLASFAALLCCVCERQMPHTHTQADTYCPYNVCVCVYVHTCVRVCVLFCKVIIKTICTFSCCCSCYCCRYVVVCMLYSVQL